MRDMTESLTAAVKTIAANIQGDVAHMKTIIPANKLMDSERAEAESLGLKLHGGENGNYYGQIQKSEAQDFMAKAKSLGWKVVPARG